jgi:hypothetical protein
MRNVWRVEFPTGCKVVQLDLSAPETQHRGDVIAVAAEAVNAAGIRVDPFQGRAELVGARP